MTQKDELDRNLSSYQLQSCAITIPYHSLVCFGVANNLLEPDVSTTDSVIRSNKRLDSFRNDQYDRLLVSHVL